MARQFLCGPVRKISAVLDLKAPQETVFGEHFRLML
jgi:hypothetical protein